MKTNGTLIKSSVFCLILVAVLGLTGITYAASATYPNGNPNPSDKSLCQYSWVVSNDDGIQKLGIDNGDDGTDPRAIQTTGTPCTRSGSAASTVALKSSSNDAIKVTITNGYPGYWPTVFFGLKNGWTTPGIVQSINIQNSKNLDVKLNDIMVNKVVDKGQEIVGALSILVSDDALPNESDTVTVTIDVVQWVDRGLFMIGTYSLADGKVGEDYTQYIAGARGTLTILGILRFEVGCQ